MVVWKGHKEHKEFNELCDVVPRTGPELNKELRKWEYTYRCIRPHQALGYKTPLQFLKDNGIINNYSNPSIPGLTFDWSVIVECDEQVATVGTHWPLSRALNKEERAVLTRTGLCMGCHIEMTNKSIWEKVSTPGSLNDEQHIQHMNQVLKSHSKNKPQDQE